MIDYLYKSNRYILLRQKKENNFQFSISNSQLSCKVTTKKQNNQIFYRFSIKNIIAVCSQTISYLCIFI